MNKAQSLLQIYRSAEKKQRVEPDGETAEKVVLEHMTHANAALDSFLRRRDFPYCFVPEQAAEEETYVEDEEEAPIYRPLPAFLGRRIPAKPHIPAHMKKVGECPLTYEEILSHGFFMKAMKTIFVPCGSTTITITLSGLPETEEPSPIGDAPVTLVVECLSHQGLLRQEVDMPFQNLVGNDKCRKEFQEKIGMMLNTYVRSKEGGLGIWP